MKRIKDFIYNHNDLLVTLIILAVATVIIYSRMNAILDYPAEVAALSAEVTKDASGEIVIPDPIVEPDPDEQTGDETGEEQQTGEGQESGSEQTSGGQTPGDRESQGNPSSGEQTSGGQSSDGQTTPVEPKDIKFTVKGQKGWQQLAQDLKDAGIIDDWHAFYYRALERYNEKPIYFYDKTYTFKTGLSNDEIIDILNTK